MYAGQLEGILLAEQVALKAHPRSPASKEAKTHAADL
jgi:hypothetical protein